jgi:hypothetical protein
MVGEPTKEARGDPKEEIMVSLPAFDITRQSRIVENGRARTLVV